MDSGVHASLDPNWHHQIIIMSSYISLTRLWLIFFYNFISHKNKICNDKDPLWFKNHIKTLIKKKNHLIKSYMANGRLAVDRVRFQRAGADLINIIKSSIEKLYKPKQPKYF